MKLNLSVILTRTASTFPDHIAVTYNDQSITYRELHRSVVMLSDYLKGEKLLPGGRVGLFLDNSIDYVIAYFAVSMAGGVMVPLDTSQSHEKLAFILGDCQAEILFVHSRLQKTLARLLELKPLLRLIISEKEVRIKTPDIEQVVLSQMFHSAVSASEYIVAGNQHLIGWDDLASIPHELAAIFYTSGSTGEPKGVMLSHRNLVANTLGTTEYLKLTERDSVMVILPFYYIYGNSLLLTHATVGGRLVIDNRFMYPELILDTMENQEVTGLSGVPSNFIILLNNSTFPKRELKSLRYFTQAGGAMAPEIIRRLHEVFNHKEIYIMYGQTEASPRVTWLPPERLMEKLGSIGIEVRGLQVRILKENGDEVGVNKEGEIVVGGDSVMMGYWNQPEEQGEVLKDGWLYTGDLARRDEDGFIFIVGRKKEIIKAGGNRVSVKEVEETLLSHEGVHEVAVFGVQDDLFGEAVAAVIVLKAGFQCDAKELQRHCRQHIADYKVPRSMHFIDEMPKYQTGKINKPLLKRQFQGK